MEIDLFLSEKRKKKKKKEQKEVMTNFSLLPSVNFNRMLKLSGIEQFSYFENSVYCMPKCVRQRDDHLAAGHFTDIIIVYKNKL